MATVSNQTRGGGHGRGALPFSTVRDRTIDRQVYAQLRQAILHGRLAPSAWLIQEDLAASFGVSRMPIRDTLRTLSAEGLVELLPHRGARVAPLTMHELEELYALRMGLEGLAARLAADRMTPPGLERMAQALRRIEDVCRSSDLEAFLAAEAEYHQVCYAVTDRERLCRQVADLRERADRYLRVVFDSSARFEESLGYQRQLYAACEGRDGPRAERVLQDALGWTLRYADAFFARQVPTPAAGEEGGPRRRP